MFTLFSESRLVKLVYLNVFYDILFCYFGKINQLLQISFGKRIWDACGKLLSYISLNGASAEILKCSPM